MLVLQFSVIYEACNWGCNIGSGILFGAFGVFLSKKEIFVNREVLAVNKW